MISERRLEGPLLLLQMVGLGLLVVPRHTNTYWEPEFSGWVVPLANRLGAGPPLYSDGAHSPLPPLPYLIVYLLTGGRGVWWHESLLNFLCQCGVLWLMFLAVCRLSGRLVAYAACSASLALFLALGKSILYDSMAQMLVACAILMALDMVANPGRRASPFALGAVLGLLLLTKQSTAAGAIAGSLLVLLRRRSSQDCVACLLGGAAVVITGLLVMSPWIDNAGFFHDTLLTGSDPKGGPQSVLLRLGFFGLQFLGHGFVGLVMGLAFLCWQGPQQRPSEACRVDDQAMRTAVLAWPMVLAVALPLAFTRWSYDFPSLTIFLMWPALIFYFATVGYEGTPAQRAAAVIAYTSTIGHCLSVHEFRFFYDNNPLVVLLLAYLIEQFFKSPPRWYQWRWWRVPVIPVTPIVVLLIGAWLHAAPRLYELGQTRLEVGDIPYLAGASLPRRAERGLLEMVREVRRQTAPTDRVLLLPEDPSLAAWFDRRRPELTSSVLFLDTYWDSMVDEDAKRLTSDPPEVIIVGPRDTWRDFAYFIKRRPEVAMDGVPHLLAKLEPLLSERYAPAREYTVEKSSPGDFLTLPKPKNEDSFSVYFLRK